MAVSYQWSHTPCILLCPPRSLSIVCSGPTHAAACQSFAPFQGCIIFHCVHGTHAVVHLSNHPLSIYPPIHQPSHPSVYPLTHPSIHPPIHQPSHPSINPTIHPFVHSPTLPSTHLSVHPPTCLSIHPPIHQPSHPSINLAIHRFIH